MHGGRIEAHSAGLGHGTQFVVQLPVVLSKSARKANSHGGTSPATPDGPARRVLIVDDTVDSGDSLALVVRSWGHEVAVARDGPSALMLAEKYRPEQALVDIALPGMDGYELGRRLREAHQRLYLVAMTGYGRMEDKRAAMTAGFDLHLVKPADPKQLHALLANGGSK